ncbi:SoxR reducing system RseC family protein [Deferribacter autotrophicus]|nr:SoxR reducing system RseC family protein [Deferribacter autotrophicus]
MSSKYVLHKARVIKIKPDGKAVLKVMRSSACGSCDDNQSCCSTGDNYTFIEVKCLEDLKEGETVNVGLKKNSFYSSIFMIYIVPVFLALFTAAITSSLSANDNILTPVATVVVIVLYFIFFKKVYKSKELEYKVFKIN